MSTEDADRLSLEEPADETEDQKFLEELYSKQSFVRDEMRLVLIGKTGSGKSATGNSLTGRNTFVSQLSGTSITSLCQDVMLERFGRRLQVVDTPGLFDTRASNTRVAKEIKRCVLMTSPGIHALILVIKIGRFTDEERKTVEYFKKVFGDRVCDYLMLIFTGRDDLDAHGTSLENYIRTAPSELQQLVAESQNRYMTVNNRAGVEEKEAFAQQLIASVDKMVQLNGGKCYTSAMFRKAEEIMKKREEEEKRKLEEEKAKEREAIEKSIKDKYDVQIKVQESKMQGLQNNLEKIQQKGKEEQRRHTQAVKGLEDKLKQAEKERTQIEADRKKWEEKRRQEMEKSEADRNQAMLTMMDKMEEDRRQREQEMDKKMEQIEKERRGREEEMRRRDEEREKKEDEQRKRMFELEQEKQKELANMRAEQRQQQEKFNQILQEQARAIARIKSGRRGGGCSIM